MVKNENSLFLMTVNDITMYDRLYHWQYGQMKSFGLQHAGYYL